MSTAPIGVMDSGLGGLTVVRQLWKIVPHESILYFGDTARVPYGEKSCDTVQRFALEAAQLLASKGVKLIVVACSTASVHALPLLNRQFKIPIIGVVEPTVNAAVRLSGGHIGVIATRSTIASQSYSRRLKQLRPQLRVDSVACPLFVPLVEECYWNHPVAEIVARDYLEPLHAAGCDSLILGCTHYPLMHRTIKTVMGSTRLIDPGVYCARAVAQLLAARKLTTPTQQTPRHTFLVSDAPDRFSQLGSLFLRRPLTAIHATADTPTDHYSSADQYDQQPAPSASDRLYPTPF